MNTSSVIQKYSLLRAGAIRGKMITKSIVNPNLFKILDEDTHKIYHGCNQEWYTKVWQRLSGCGPTVASNLIFYLYLARQTLDSGQSFISKRICLSLMEEIWEYVTPRVKGVSTTEMFYKAVLAYAKFKGLDVQYRFFDLPKNKLSRPRLSALLKFLDEALGKDAPIAFLNLCNGAEKILDRWHWVTIISLEYTENGDHAFVDILDDGQIKKINLALWYNTTSNDGGFVYFTTASLMGNFDTDNHIVNSG
jgi:hypothetical protein